MWRDWDIYDYDNQNKQMLNWNVQVEWLSRHVRTPLKCNDKKSIDKLKFITYS